jgi:hypothetical protein
MDAPFHAAYVGGSGGFPLVNSHAQATSKASAFSGTGSCAQDMDVVAVVERGGETDKFCCLFQFAPREPGCDDIFARLLTGRKSSFNVSRLNSGDERREG